MGSLGGGLGPPLERLHLLCPLLLHPPLLRRGRLALAALLAMPSTLIQPWCRGRTHKYTNIYIYIYSYIYTRICVSIYVYLYIHLSYTNIFVCVFPQSIGRGLKVYFTKGSAESRRDMNPAAASLQQAVCRSHGEADRLTLVSLLRA